MEIIINALIKAAGWSIIHALWQSAMIYVALLFLLMFGSSMKAKTKYTLSYLALSTMLLCFAQTFYSEFQFWMQQQSSAGFHSVYPSLSGSPIEALTLSASLLEKTERIFPLIVFLYAAGLIIQSVFLFLGYYRIRQLKRTGLSDLSSDLQKHFSDLTDRLGLKRAISFRVSSKVSVPLVIGYLKPLVLLPLSVLSHLDQKQLEAVIIHELAHIRRNDYLLNLLKVTIETILFFNPFVWLCSKLIEREREHACDDFVLEVTGQALIYAQTLMKLEHLKQQHLPLTLAITGKKFHLLNRIRRMTDSKTTTHHFKVQFLTIVLISSLLLSVAWIPVKKNQEIAVKFSESDPEDTAAEPLVITFKRDAKGHEFKSARIGQAILQNDTTKRTFKIIFEDEHGRQKIYNSIEEMPADLRADFLNGNQSGIYSAPVYHFGTEFNGFISKPNKDSLRFKGVPIDSLNSLRFNGRVSGTGKDSIDTNIADSSFWFKSVKRAADSVYRSIALSEVRVIGSPISNNKSGEIVLEQNQGSLQKQGNTIQQPSDKLNGIKPDQLNNMKAPPVKQSNELIIEILRSPESRHLLESLLEKKSYFMNPDGKLEENTNVYYNFKEGTIKKSDVLKFIRPGIKNTYGIYIPTTQEKLRNLVNNPANQDKLNKIVNDIPHSPDLTMNKQVVYTFDEGMFQKEDIIEYLYRSGKTY
jgi:beta-lactamase regulating signal transducer with metallopeptidase domain